MAYEHETENDLPEPSEGESPKDGSPDEEPLEGEAGKVEEAETVSAEPEDEPAAGEISETGDENADSPVVEQFVDFDVWLATLEANFGQDFEQVLYEKIGPDWNAQINDKMMSGENFYQVVQNLKQEIANDAEEILDEEHTSFETLNADGGVGGPGGGGGSGVGGAGGGSGTGGEGGTGGAGGAGGAGGGDSIPLADLQRKEFKAQDQFKLDTKPDEYQYEKILRYKGDKEEKEDREEEVVLVDRSDFSQLSYYAHKEKERHQDDVSMKKLLKRESRARLSPYKRMYLAVAFAAGALFLYAAFCVISYFACGFYSRGLLKSLPPDLVFRPSTALHKQGELAGFDSADRDREQPLIFYTLRPTLKKMDLIGIGGGSEQQFELAVCNPSMIVLPKGPRQDSITVQKHYRRFLPVNLGGLLGKPYLSLTEGGTVVLDAYETNSSSLLPGLMQLEITDGQGLQLGRAYVTGDRLNILLEGLKGISPEQLQVWQLRLVFLFSLLEI